MKSLTNKPPNLLFDKAIFPPCDLTMSCAIDKPNLRQIYLALYFYQFYKMV